MPHLFSKINSYNVLTARPLESIKDKKISPDEEDKILRTMFQKDLHYYISYINSFNDDKKKIEDNLNNYPDFCKKIFHNRLSEIVAGPDNLKLFIDKTSDIFNSVVKQMLNESKRLEFNADKLIESSYKCFEKLAQDLVLKSLEIKNLDTKDNKVIISYSDQKNEQRKEAFFTGASNGVGSTTGHLAGIVSRASNTSYNTVAAGVQNGVEIILNLVKDSVTGKETKALNNKEVKNKNDIKEKYEKYQNKFLENINENLLLASEISKGFEDVFNGMTGEDKCKFISAINQSITNLGPNPDKVIQPEDRDSIEKRINPNFWKNIDESRKNNTDKPAEDIKNEEYSKIKYADIQKILKDLGEQKPLDHIFVMLKFKDYVEIASKNTTSKQKEKLLNLLNKSKEEVSKFIKKHGNSLVDIANYIIGVASGDTLLYPILSGISTGFIQGTETYNKYNPDSNGYINMVSKKPNLKLNTNTILTGLSNNVKNNATSIASREFENSVNPFDRNGIGFFAMNNFNNDYKNNKKQDINNDGKPIFNLVSTPIQKFITNMQYDDTLIDKLWKYADYTGQIKNLSYNVDYDSAGIYSDIDDYLKTSIDKLRSAETANMTGEETDSFARVLQIGPDYDMNNIFCSKNYISHLSDKSFGLLERDSRGGITKNQNEFPLARVTKDDEQSQFLTEFSENNSVAKIKGDDNKIGSDKKPKQNADDMTVEDVGANEGCEHINKKAIEIINQTRTQISVESNSKPNEYVGHDPLHEVLAKRQAVTDAVLKEQQALRDVLEASRESAGTPPAKNNNTTRNLGPDRGKIN